MQPKTFIHQLHHMLNDKSLESWIRWSAEDDHIFCLKPYDPEFPGKVLKKNFKHGNVSSFVRQLHMYGFHKLQTGPNGMHTTVNAGAGAGLPASAATAGSTTSMDNEPPTHIIKSNKESMVWYFTHPSGYFYKDACQPDLARIQRKSNGVGKDGKRKNGLSPVCVSILDPNARASTPPITATSTSSQIDSLHRYSVPPAYAAAGEGGGGAAGATDSLQPHQSIHEPRPSYNDVTKRRSASSLDLLINHPQSLPAQQQISGAAPVSTATNIVSSDLRSHLQQPQHAQQQNQQNQQNQQQQPRVHRPGFPTSTTSTALVQQHTPSHSQPALRPSIFTLPQQQQQQQQQRLNTNTSPTAQPHITTGAVTTTTPMDYLHYESNLQLLQRCMLTIVDILQIPPSQQHTISKLQQNLNHLKSEILSMDHKWTNLRPHHPYYTSSPHSSLSSEASGPLHFNPISSAATATSSSIPGQLSHDSRFSSLSTQKNSIFSNPRLSNVNSSTSTSNGNLSVSGTSTQFDSYYQHETKTPGPIFPPIQQQSQYAYPPPQHHAPHHSQSQGSTNILH